MSQFLICLGFSGNLEINFDNNRKYFLILTTDDLSILILDNNYWEEIFPTKSRKNVVTQMNQVLMRHFVMTSSRLNKLDKVD